MSIKSVLITAAFLAGSVHGGSRFSSSDSLDNYTFENYIKEGRKKYSPAEYEKRSAIFKENLLHIQEHNKKNSNYKLGVNRFTDRTPEEKAEFFGGNKYSMHTNGKVQTSLLKTSLVKELPAYVDWRDHSPSVMTPVKDQGHCGSCWAFAATETIESHVALNTGILNELSPQDLVSCMSNDDHCGGIGGCQGATAELAFDYLASDGIVELWGYGYAVDTYYKGINNQCKRGEDSEMVPAATGTGYNLLERNDYNEIMNAIANVGPLAVNVDASSWHDYESGVFSGCPQTDVQINHVVQLVGYGTTDDGEDYWLVRNSWSPEWGEDGYIKLQREDGYCGMDYHNSYGVGCDYDPTNVTVCGMCGIMYDVSYPTGASDVSL